MIIEKSILLVTFLLLPLSYQTPQIFEDKETCKVSYKYQEKIKEYRVPWLITAEDRDLQLSFSLCEHLPTSFSNNGSCAKTCLYNKKSKSLITTKQSNKIPYEVEEHSNDEITLILKDQLKCTDDRNYEITVKMIKLDRLMEKPHLIVQNECEIIVEMVKPDYEPPCTYLLSTKELINLKPLKGKKISIPWEGKEFKMALCGGNRDCGLGNSGCIKEKNFITILGTTSSQKVRFDTENHQLKVVASYIEGHRKTRMEILLKCNWTVPTFSNAKFIKPSTQGRNYNFEIDSSFGCVKMASNCLINDKNNGFTYDLTGLSTRSGSKVVLEGTNFILINICGDLQAIGPRENNCEEGHSQVCEINEHMYINKGSIPTFEITKEHFVRLVLKEGQKCNESSSYSTVIDIKCSFNEKGPVFVKSEDCITTLLWETPKGCPKYESTTDSCAVKTYLGGIDVSNLYGNNDKIHSFSPSEKFVFNVCGKIHSNCSSQNDVSACYITQDSQQIIGWNAPTLSHTSGKLQLKYYGEKCGTDDKLSSLTINLYCSYAQNPTQTKLNKRDSCTFEANIYSLSACLSQDVVDCTIENNALEYDLTPLIAKEKNYKVQDESDGNMIYFLNICRPLVNENGLIAGNSMIYSMDKSQPHIWDRFTSIGKIGRPVLNEDGKLAIKAILGRSCGAGIDYSGVINFDCSDKSERPKLVEKNGCHFEFLWRTKYACPVVKPGGSCILNGEQMPSDEIKVERNGNTYSFSLCDENYNICNKASCIKNKLTRRVTEQHSKVNVEVNLASSSLACAENILKTANVTIECEPNSQRLKSTISQNLCHVDILMKTSLICRTGKEFVPLAPNIKNVKNKNPRTANDEKNIMKIEPFSETVQYLPEVEIKENSAKVKSPSNNENDTEEKVSENEEVVIPIKNNETPDYIQKNVNDKELNDDSEVHADKDKILENTGLQTSLENGKLKSIEKYQHKKCDTVKIGTKMFNVDNIGSSTITGTNTYIINFNGSSSNCGGKICKNAKPILHFIDDCPQVVYSQNIIQLSYTIEKECLTTDNLTQTGRTEDLKIDIFLKCKGSLQIMKVFEKTNCIIEFEYFSPEICDLVENTNHSSVIATSIGVAFLITSMLILSFVLYRRNRKRCSYNSVNNPENSYINHSKLL